MWCTATNFAFLSVLMTPAYVCRGIEFSGPILHLLLRRTLRITFSRGATCSDCSQVRSRLFVASCTAYAMNSPRCHLLARKQRPHIARLSQQCVQEYNVLSWPLRSSYRALLDHLWDMLEMWIQSSRNTTELVDQLFHLWQNLPQSSIDNLLDCMSHRALACIVFRKDLKIDICLLLLANNLFYSEFVIFCSSTETLCTHRISCWWINLFWLLIFFATFVAETHFYLPQQLNFGTSVSFKSIRFSVMH